jgi:DNA mismatch repair ATPase MutL
MEALVKDLELFRPSTTCPHGRPVMVVIDQNQLERLFARR